MQIIIYFVFRKYRLGSEMTKYTTYIQDSPQEIVAGIIVAQVGRGLLFFLIDKLKLALSCTGPNYLLYTGPNSLL